MQNIIQLQHVQKKIKDQIIVKNLDFSVKKGEIFGFLGPSGAGKTTTINMMTGLFKVSKGSLNVLGYNASKLGTSQFMHNIGIMTDHSSLYHRLTIYENLKLFSDIYQIPTQRIDEVLENVELNDHRNKRISELSSGMKQRVLLARAIIHKPKLLFLDEPTRQAEISYAVFCLKKKKINTTLHTTFTPLLTHLTILTVSYSSPRPPFT
ncbi:ABC transporter ATP-binding protein, partial [Streptococcus suis]